MKKRGLVVEGGGMRSAYASGALYALQELKIQKFDVVVGTSAGACCAINFVGGEALNNFKILHDYLTGNRFIRFSKIPTRQNIVDVDYLLDEVIQHHVPLPIEAVKKTKTEIFITATDCETGQAIYFPFNKKDLIERLRASCAMPYFYRRKVMYQGHRLIDGGVAASIPIQKVIEKKCDEMVVISTRPKGYRKKPNPVGWINHIFFPRHPQMVKAFNERWKEYNQTLDWLENPPHGVKVILIRPQAELDLARTTRDRNKIKKGFEQGYQDAMQILRNQFSDDLTSPQSIAI